ncbi:indole-3-glycerol phosphate synthase TrpC [Alkalicoccus chagannorensis]|uniref:indole-3-glycerol phosphate synthase TrpC n=1 Tax=Alkalicoccus chagannorensis TaxID=427072 RepID=UPI00047AAE77|nr:indole-3-glycerol phosphate synthase TrpC [Alkalicoccus chagannorensis]
MLTTIKDRKKEEIRSLHLPERADVSREKRSFADSLRRASLQPGVIAEVKKASPSKGVIVEDFHPASIAAEYEEAGAAGISVLTDRDFFQGDNAYLTAVKQTVGLPVLRKDFIIDEIQVREADLIGADAVLLIAAILDRAQLQELHDQAVEAGMEVLVEVHNEEEAEKVLSVIRPALFGVNNRDLNTFETDLEVTKRLAGYTPEGSLLISESGVHTAADAQRLKSYGASGLLIGEGFMRSQSRSSFLQTLLGGSA